MKLWVIGLGQGVRYTLSLIKKRLFLTSWIWERFRSRFPFRNLKTAHDKTIKVTQINLIILTNKGNAFGARVVTGIVT